MSDELLKKLLEAGVHFGHQKKRWNPKMKKFIFGQRSGIYIIDLEKTVDCLNAARDFLTDLAAKGEGLLFVGTKHQAQEIVRKEAERCGVFYVVNRWLGGLLTNFATVRRSIGRLNELEKMREDGTFDMLSKKEVSQLSKELEKLKKNFSGIIKMEKMPAAIFMIDTKKEETAVKEARKLGIPIVALIDTNSDPELVDYPIPGNDDAMKSISIITSLVADSVAEGRKKFLSYLSQEGVRMEKGSEAPEEPTEPAVEKPELEIDAEALLEEEKKKEKIAKKLRAQEDEEKARERKGKK